MSLRQFWQSSVEDKFDVENPIQTKAEFSFAIAVMDKIGGSEEVNWVGSRFAASMWIFTKAVIYAMGKTNMQNYRLSKLRHIMMEAVNWVCDDPLDEDVWISQLTICCQEATVLEPLQYDLANSCTFQWRNVVVLGTNESQQPTCERWSDPREIQ